MAMLDARTALLACAILHVGCTVVTSQPRTSEGGGDGVAGASGVSGSTGSGGSLVAPGGAWVNVTANLIDLDTACGNMSMVAAKPDEDLLIAGVANQGLWSSDDGGKSWQHMGEGDGSDVIVHRPSSLVFDPEESQRFWESGIYGAAAYESTDDGKTFSQLGDAMHSDSVSVDLSDSARKTIVIGGHEQTRTLNQSDDGGMNWTAIGAGIPDGKDYCTFPLVMNSKTYLVGCTGGGVYRTTDGAKTWTQSSKYGGGAAPLKASDGRLYWANQYPGGLARSDDDGVTWKQVAEPGVVLAYTPIELPDGRIASLDQHTVVVSADRGETWQAASPELPYVDSRGLAYSKQQKAFFVWHLTCDDTSAHVPADAIIRSEFDYSKK